MNDEIHPGGILLRSFLTRLNISVEVLANELNIEVEQLQQILCCGKPINKGLGRKLDIYFNTTPGFWSSTQFSYDMTKKLYG